MDTTRRLRMVVGALAAATVGLVGCGSGDDDSATEDPAEATPDTTADSDSESEPAELDLTGLAVINSDGGMYEVPRLEFVDPSTGEVRTTVAYADVTWEPADGEIESRRSYSGDWRYMAVTLEGDDAAEVRVMRLNEAESAYEELFAVSGVDEASYSTDPTEYRSPRFGPEGPTLWMESGPAGGDEFTVVSVDVEMYEEGDEPESSGVGNRERDAWALDAGGRPVPTLRDDMREAAAGGEDGPTVGFWTDAGGAVVAEGFRDNCSELGRLDDGAYLLATCGGSALARAVLDPQAGTLQVTELVPEGADGMPETAVVSPDATEALLRIEDVWYLASLATPGAEPQPVDGLDVDFRGQDANASTLLGWS
ncbi:MAG TPA: hypothetical protein VK611_17200 [Acidimicrobiales bacterium]|nr:hypothetical protein [Acidimicrobiales bacterium]